MRMYILVLCIGGHQIGKNGTHWQFKFRHLCRKQALVDPKCHECPHIFTTEYIVLLLN